MTTQYLTYEILKNHEHTLHDFFLNWLPKLSNRKQFKPEFDHAILLESSNTDYIATIRLGMIETILKPMNFTYTYHIYPTGIVFIPVPYNTTNGSQPYAYLIEKWADTILQELNPREQLNLTETLETPDPYDHIAD